MKRYFFLIFLFLFLFSCNNIKECKELMQKSMQEPELIYQLVDDTTNTTKAFRHDFRDQNMRDYFVDIVKNKFKDGYEIYYDKEGWLQVVGDEKIPIYGIKVRNKENDQILVFGFIKYDKKYKLNGILFSEPIID